VDIEIQRTSKALDECDRAGPGDPLRVPGFPYLVGGRCPADNARHHAHHRRADGSIPKDTRAGFWWV